LVVDLTNAIHETIGGRVFLRAYAHDAEAAMCDKVILAPFFFAPNLIGTAQVVFLSGPAQVSHSPDAGRRGQDRRAVWWQILVQQLVPGDRNHADSAVSPRDNDDSE
jgi:hypothetical protein